jgi:SAM-dependent methyltransferase
MREVQPFMEPYFIRRELGPGAGYETTYWGEVIDPDGTLRHRLDECPLFLDDAKQELAFLNGLTPGRILDYGCGPGFLLSALSPGWEKYGVDISRIAAEQASKWGTIFVGELTERQYPDGYFDAVVMYHVIEHLPDPCTAIREVHRILAEDGVLLLGTPDFDCACARRFGENFRLLKDPTHISLFTCDSMHRFLRDHGFIIDRAEFPYFETRHFTPENLMRLFDTSRVSPPFYGNVMTFYCRKGS